MKSWQAVLLNLFFRIFVKHARVDDLIKLREKNQKIDEKRYSVPTDVSIKPQIIQNVDCFWISTPESDPSKIILYIHGGAFCLKFPKSHTIFAAKLCRETGSTALYVDYRLAPEYPFPAAPDDCFAVYKWLLQNGYNPSRTTIAGDSAGGNLAFSTLIRSKLEKINMPACSVLFSPAMDMTLTGASFVENQKKDVLFTLNTLLKFRQAYMRDTLPDHQLLSPLYGDFAGLPPLFFQVSDSELLRDSSILAAQKARRADVPVKLDIKKGMIHCFGLFGFLPESRETVRKAADFINSFVS